MNARTITTRSEGVPIGMQLAILMTICLVAAQVLSFMLFFALPRPRPPAYRLNEIARAFQGEATQGSAAARLIRSVDLKPPTATNRTGPLDDAARRDLAALLRVPENRVRLTHYRSPLQLRWGLRRLEPPPQGLPPEALPSPSLDTTPFGRELMVGEIAAAVQQPDSRWITLRSPRNPFPDPWQQIMGWWLFACLAVVAPTSYFVARQIIAPLDRFANAAEALGRDPRGPPIPLRGSAEIGRAARAFNDMQARIQRYVSSRTAMFGAISHDLRTPLARIRFKMQKAPDSLKTAVLADVEQMERMIGSLLAFIRDTNEAQINERIDLLSLVECVADEAVVLGGDVEVVTASPCSVQGDALALKRMLSNLVDNAVKYGALARISVTEANGEALIDIKDNGAGLPEIELERVFTPFYRGSAARTLDSGGVGLGLSAARTIAQTHGGNVILALAERGILARVSLPLAAPAG